ncbi:MAG: AAA family ATPase [Clostridiales bacterium]|nr:AAA family ATPase [Clostridiales bacterium]
MIIKEIKIIAFGGVKDLHLKIQKGMNVIYGENEKGKSTIEIFIKTMLYGFGKKKINGDTERKKYIPFSGEKISGELIIENEGFEYIIRRTFGATKKDDTSIILNAITGEKVDNINEDEPGKTFLKINKSTFEKTLFISQLGVFFTKDKEEEIMDKITSFLGCGEEEVPVSRAFEKLNNMKKELITPRGNGSLDILKNREANLLEERYQLYKISEENLERESELYNEKIKRTEIKDEINKLEVYKKYIKKLKLQEEYKDILDYLRKSEELKKKEEEIQNNLNKGNAIIDSNLIEILEDENNNYLRLLDRRDEIGEEYKITYNHIEEVQNKINEYSFIKKFGNNLREELIKIKYKQQTLSDKIRTVENLNNEILKEEKNLENRKKQLNKFSAIKNYKENIEMLFIDYENKLHELKFLAEKNKHKNQNPMYNYVFLGVGVILFLLGAITSFLGNILGIFGMAFIVLGVLITLKAVLNIKEVNENKKINIKITKTNNEIKAIEDNLNKYVKLSNAKDYTELLSILRRYTLYQEYEETSLASINEKRNIMNSDEYIKAKQEFNNNIKFINDIRRESECNNIEDVLVKINNYEKLMEEYQKFKFDLDGKENLLKQLDRDIKYNESVIRDKFKIIGIEINDILDAGVILKEYKDNIKKLEETHNSLVSIEQTYEVLLKDRDIEEIKNELKDLITENNPYSYESEEEIEVNEKRKTHELLECEKKIKDIENLINTRLIGKRDIVQVEEELEEVKSLIEKEEKEVKAIDLALKTLNDSVDEIRKNIGPEINKRIEKNFKFLTDNKYLEVKLSSDYSMVVRDKLNLFHGKYLSNGALDQLYISLRLALIELLFNDEECPVILDDALIQYDDYRRGKALLLINSKVKGQIIMFTCQRKEEELLKKEGIDSNYINL